MNEEILARGDPPAGQGQSLAGHSVVTGAGSDPGWSAGCPYLGLLPFDQAHAGVFCGRQQLTAELVVKLAGRLAGPAMVVVSGASGAGKSSLLQAGLLPALAAGLQLAGSGSWPRLVMTPTSDPLAELATRLAALGGGDAAAIRGELAAHPDRAYLVIRQVLADTFRPGGLRPPADGWPGRLVLVVDQFEEVFTLGPARGDASQQAFIAALCAAATQPAGPGGEPAALVVIAVRGDFWARCAAHAGLARMMQDGLFVVGPMTAEELRQAITGPAAAAGLQVDADLADTILADLRAAGHDTAEGTLPLLSQAMMLTWGQREGNWLTVRGYHQTGGVARCVEFGAEAVYQALPAAGQHLAREIFQALVLVGPDGQLARRLVPRADLYAGVRGTARRAVDNVLEAFAGSRLLVLDGDTVQIAHDVLLRAWPRLRGWLDREQASWILYIQLQEDAARWAEHGRDPSFLYRGSQLAAVQQAAGRWAADPARYPALAPDQSGFLQAGSRKAARSARVRRVAVLTLVLLLVASVAATSVAVSQRGRAVRQATISEAGQLAAIAETLTGSNLSLAELFAAEAYHLYPDPQTRAALLQAVTADPHLVRYLPATGTVSAVAASADGNTAVAGTADGAVLRWNLASFRRTVVARLPAHTPISGVAVSADGDTIAAIGGSAADIWVQGRGLRSIPVSRKWQTDAVAVSPSGQYAAFAIHGDSYSYAPDYVMLVDARTGRLVMARFATIDGISHLAFSGEKQLVGFGGAGFALPTWERLAVPSLRTILTSSVGGGLGGMFVAFALSPTGTFVSVTTNTSTTAIWTTLPPSLSEPPRYAQEGGRFPDAVAISADGRRAAEADAGTIYVSDVTASGDATSGTPLPLTGNETINPDGLAFIGRGDSALLSASGDLITLWNLDQYSRIATEAPAGIPQVCDACSGPSIAASPTDNYAVITVNGLGPPIAVVVSLSAGHVHVLQQASNAPTAPGRGPYGPVAWSQDGREFFILNPSGNDGEFWSAARNVSFVRAWVARPAAPPGSTEDTPLLMTLTGDDKQIVEIDGTGHVVLRSAATGAVEHTVAGPVSTGYGLASGLVAVDHAAGYAALISQQQTRGQVGVVNLRTGAVTTLPGGPATGVAYAGELLLVQRSDGTLEVRSADGRRLIRSFAGDVNAVAAPVVGGTGLAVELNEDGTAPVFDVASGEEIGTITLPPSRPFVPTSIAFTPDGKYLISATGGWPSNTSLGQVTEWDFSPSLWSAVACASAGQTLTAADWQEYVGTDAPGMPDQLACES